MVISYKIIRITILTTVETHQEEGEGYYLNVPIAMMHHMDKGWRVWVPVPFQIENLIFEIAFPFQNLTL